MTVQVHSSHCRPKGRAWKWSALSLAASGDCQVLKNTNCALHMHIRWLHDVVGSSPCSLYHVRSITSATCEDSRPPARCVIYVPALNTKLLRLSACHLHILWLPVDLLVLSHMLFCCRIAREKMPKSPHKKNRQKYLKSSRVASFSAEHKTKIKVHLKVNISLK